jgi:phosphohistidine phosphatase SixA
MILKRFIKCPGCVLLLILASGAFAQTLNDDELVSALQKGGYAIVMRHASSPRQAPSSDTANPDNPDRERQLDETGRNDAITMGMSIRKLGIPISQIESSPTYRTRETAYLAGFREVQIREYLGNRGMQNSSEVYTSRLLESLKRAPRQGNRLLITHSPNIAAAFPELNAEVEQGEALVFDPEVSISVPVARISINRWASLK